MPWLKVYEWEREKWSAFQEVRLDMKHAMKITEKLADDFGVAVPKLIEGKWRGKIHHQIGQYLWRTQTIKVAVEDLTLGILCHEFTHHLLWHRHRDVSHRKRFRNTLAEVYEQAKRFLDTHGSWEPVNTKLDVLVRK